jgi:TetR/AcrR family transcriptional repressor of bet genes
MKQPLVLFSRGTHKGYLEHHNWKVSVTENKIKRTDTGQNKSALIHATLDAIADIGFAKASVTEIITRANLSRGMIHLHFHGKANLMIEAAKFANSEYHEVLELRLRSAGPSPQEQLATIIRSDLSETVLNRKSASIWYELRGASRHQPEIARYSDTRDARLRDLFFSVFLKIATAQNMCQPDVVARDATHGSIALLEGMWTDYLLHPNSFGRKSAERIVFRFLSALFPDHFNLSGAIM